MVLPSPVVFRVIIASGIKLCNLEFCTIFRRKVCKKLEGNTQGRVTGCHCEALKGRGNLFSVGDGTKLMMAYSLIGVSRGMRIPTSGFALPAMTG